MDKAAFYGIVNSADYEDAAVTPEAVAGKAEIAATAASCFYFGKPSNPTTARKADGTVLAGDVAAAKKMVLGTIAATTTPDAYIAADVANAEPDGGVKAGDVAALKKNVLNKTALPVLGQ